MDKNQLIIKVQLFLPRSNNKVDNIEIEWSKQSNKRKNRWRSSQHKNPIISIKQIISIKLWQIWF